MTDSCKSVQDRIAGGTGPPQGCLAGASERGGEGSLLGALFAPVAHPGTPRGAGGEGGQGREQEGGEHSRRTSTNEASLSISSLRLSIRKRRKKPSQYKLLTSRRIPSCFCGPLPRQPECYETYSLLEPTWRKEAQRSPSPCRRQKPAEDRNRLSVPLIAAPSKVSVAASKQSTSVVFKLGSSVAEA